MPRRNRALLALVVILSIALLIAPALWNGFVLLQWDTGGYLARWYEGYLVPSRAVIYDLILTAGAPLAFWPIVLLQSALTVWIVAQMLRAQARATAPTAARCHRRAIAAHDVALADLDPAHRYFCGLKRASALSSAAAQ